MQDSFVWSMNTEHLGLMQSRTALHEGGEKNYFQTCSFAQGPAQNVCFRGKELLVRLATCFMLTHPLIYDSVAARAPQSVPLMLDTSRKVLHHVCD